MITGLVIGKWMPLHKGHMALIDYAKEHCDKLIVLVIASPKETIPYKYRLKWVLSTYLDDPQIDVFGDIVDDSHMTSDEKSIWWGKYVTSHYGKIDRIFSSEDYGKLFAESAGAESWVFDKGRHIVPISGTMIRNKPLSNWDYLNNFAKDFFVKKIAIVGTESTGKTTMAKQLAEHFNTVWCPEAGRSLIPSSKQFTIEDLKIVATEHAKNILKYTRLSNKLLFIDTDLNITKSYSNFFFNQVPSFEPWVEKANEVDLYIYLASDAPYHDDGTRLPEDTRNELNKSHISFFKDKNNVEWMYWLSRTQGDQEKYNERLSHAIQEIEFFISNY